MAAARSRLARWAGADEDGFALVPNVSAGVTVALSSADVPPGGRIVVTSHCDGAVRFAGERFARLRGATVVEVPVPLPASPDEVVALVSPAVEAADVVLLDQITSPTRPSSRCPGWSRCAVRPAFPGLVVALPSSVRIEDQAAEEAPRSRIARAEVNVTVHEGRAFLRLSAHAYNGARDYELLAARLPALL